ARAAREEHEQERQIRARAARIRESAERERREAEKWPAGSEKREYHQGLATAWDAAIWQVPFVQGERAGRRGRAINRHRAPVVVGRREAESSLERLERFAGEVGRRPDTPEWQLLQVDAKLEAVQEQMRDEVRAKAVKAFLSARFPAGAPGTTG